MEGSDPSDFDDEYAGVEIDDEPPPNYFHVKAVPGWTSKQWIVPTGAISEIEINDFASGPDVLPNHPIGEFFVPSTMRIPEDRCLLPGDVPSAMKAPSNCHCEIRGLAQPEVVGCDPRMNKSAEEITRFFLTHLKNPRLLVKVEGWHMAARTFKDPKGHSRTTYNRETDFECEIINAF
jgi:hypothetical protein